MKLKSKNKVVKAAPKTPATKKTEIATSTEVSIQDNALQQLLNLSNRGGALSVTEDLDFLEDKAFEGFDPTAGMDVDVVGMVLDAIENTNLVAPDLKIDDSSCAEAPNVLSWLLDDGFLGCEAPYLEQALICVQLFAEYCPRCSDTHWMDIENHEPQEGLGALLENVVMMDYGVCPQCKAHRSDLIANDELNFYNELAVLAGQRSGKSIVTAMAATYVTHRILKMQKPTEIYNVGKGQVLHGTFVALTAGQAKDTLWDPYYGYLVESPWFKKYHALLDHYQRKYHQEFYKLKDTFVLYKHRKLTFYPAGPDKRVLRGRTRILGAIDEIGWFDNAKNSQKVKIDANGVYEAMVRSLATVRSSEERLIDMGFDQALTAHMLNISSPSSIRDKICELVRTSQGSKKTLGIHAPTWKMNPNITRNAGFLLEEYRKDPVTAQRDYGAEPPLSANPFIGNVELVRQAFNPKLRNPIKYKQKTITLGKEKYRYAEIEKVQEIRRPSLMAIDAGYSNNSFALVVGSFNTDMLPTVDVVVEVMSMPGMPLNYTMIYEEVMKPLIEARNIRILLADRWNSIKILQDAQIEFEDRDFQQKQYSLKYSDFWNVKNALEQFTFIIPMIEKGQELDEVLKESLDDYPRCFDGRPVSHLALQILTVQDSGRTVLKGEGELTDDIWRASCLAYWGMQQEEYIDILTATENLGEAVKKPLGYSIMGSANGGGNNKNAGNSGTKQSHSGGVLGLIQGRK